MRLRAALVAGLALALLPTLFLIEARAARPELDRSFSVPADEGVVAAAQRLQSDALRRLGTVAHVDARYGLPTIVWATPSRTASALSGRLTSMGRFLRS